MKRAVFGVAVLVALTACGTSGETGDGSSATSATEQTATEKSSLVRPASGDEATAAEAHPAQVGVSSAIAACDEYLRSSERCVQRLQGDAFAEKRAHLEKQRASLLTRSQRGATSVQPLERACKRALETLPTQCRR